MMNGFMPSAGAESALKSGTSAPAHLAPFQPISLRFGSHGLPEGSHEARLYWIRRLGGHEEGPVRGLAHPLRAGFLRPPPKVPFSPPAAGEIQPPPEELPSSLGLPW